MKKVVMTYLDIEKAWEEQQKIPRVKELLEKANDLPEPIRSSLKDTYEAGFYGGLAYYERHILKK